MRQTHIQENKSVYTNKPQKHMKPNQSEDDDNKQNQQAVGGRPSRYAPAQACNGSAQGQPRARPAEPGPISQYALSSRPATHAARRPDVCDRRQTSDRRRPQTDRRQTASSLNAPWAEA